MVQNLPLCCISLKKIKIPWILKWQYVKDGDILNWHWFVKWWDKFPQTDLIVETVNKEFAQKIARTTIPAVAVAPPAITKLLTPDVRKSLVLYFFKVQEKDRTFKERFGNVESILENIQA
jgi:hypothetical protein